MIADGNPQMDPYDDVWRWCHGRTIGGRRFLINITTMTHFSTRWFADLYTTGHINESLDTCTRYDNSQQIYTFWSQIPQKRHQ